MAKYMLVSFETCPWVQRSAIVLREKNTEFELRHIKADNRPDWFLAISPHKKVPVLSIDDKVSLFESNAINEYLDEMNAPRLHPEDPIERAVNRAWTDYVPTFASSVTGCAYAATEADYQKATAKIPEAFDRLHKIGQLENYPRLKAWTEAIMNRPSTHSFPAAEFEAMYRTNVKRRNSWVSQFIEPVRAAAE